MKSPFTGKEMKVVERPGTLTICKKVFQIKHRVWQCVDSGEEFEYDVDEAIRQAENQYRSNNNLPFPGEII